MEVRIEELAPVEVACVRRQGPYIRSAKAAWEALWGWVKAKGLAGQVRQAIGYGHHDPAVTPGEQCLYDACLAIEGGFETDDPVGRQMLPGGRYAILTLHGSYEQIPDGFARLRDEFLPSCGEPVDARPWIERYLNDPCQVPEAEILTELCVPLAGKVIRV